MKFKGTLWLIAGLLSLVLYYFLVDLPQEQKATEDKERSEKILLFDPADVEEFSISQNDEVLTLKRQGKEEWNLLKPVEAKADTPSTTSYLGQLQAMQFTRVVDESTANLSVYGLDQPSLTISLKLKGQKEISLLAGDDNPMGNSLYIKRNDENKILLTSAPRSSLGKSVYDLRDKKVLEFDADEIGSLEIQRQGSALKFIKTGESWSVTENITARGDAGEIKNLLNTILSAQVQKFVAENPESLTPFGLDKPLIQLTLQRGEKDPPLSLSVGDKNAAGYYAKVGGAKNIVLLSGQLIKKLSRNMTAFMDKTLTDVKEEVTALQLRSQEENIRLTRDPSDKNKWNIEHPLKTPANTATVNSLLFDLKDIRIEKFIEAPLKDPELFGLKNPDQELTVMRKTGEPWTLRLGNKNHDEKLFFANRSGDSSVFTLGKESVEKIFRSLHELRDRKILRFKIDEIVRILIEYPKQNIELIRKEKEWSLVQPEVIGKIKALHGKDILWTLNALEFESQASPSMSDSETGLDKPILAITIWTKNNQKLPTLTIGKQVENQSEHYARVEGSPALHRIKSRFLDEIPSNINKFKD